MKQPMPTAQTNHRRSGCRERIFLALDRNPDLSLTQLQERTGCCRDTCIMARKMWAEQGKRTK